MWLHPALASARAETVVMPPDTIEAPSRPDVDRVYRQLLAMRVHVLDAAAEYPAYGRGYYAVFFADPDGIKLEYAFTPG